MKKWPSTTSSPRVRVGDILPHALRLALGLALLGIFVTPFCLGGREILTLIMNLPQEPDIPGGVAAGHMMQGYILAEGFLGAFVAARALSSLGRLFRQSYGEKQRDVTGKEPEQKRTRSMRMPRRSAATLDGRLPLLFGAAARNSAITE